MAYQKYSIDITSYQKTQQVSSDCNTLQFVNLGTNAVTINNAITLITNQTFTIEGNENEICTTTFLLTFATGGTSNCAVIKKNFV